MRKQKLAVCPLLSSLVTFGILAYVSAFGSSGFEVYETYTHVWNINLDTVYVGIPKSFNVTVECKELAGEFFVTYFLEMSGPASLCNDYLRLWWRDTDGADFTIGQDGDQRFLGTGTLTWNSSPPAVFKPGHKNNITLTLTFLTTASLGNYNAKFWVTATIETIQARIDINPDTINLLSKGELIKAYIKLPTPHKITDIDYRTVKLWYLNNYVPAKAGKLNGTTYIAEFPRPQVIQMLKDARGRIQLTVTGIAKTVEFQGTDTVWVIKSFT